MANSFGILQILEQLKVSFQIDLFLRLVTRSLEKIILILAYTRVGGNKKGIFTRDRQPKMAAHHVRKRYHALAAEYDKQKLPDDLENYVISLNSS